MNRTNNLRTCDGLQRSKKENKCEDIPSDPSLIWHATLGSLVLSTVTNKKDLLIMNIPEFPHSLHYLVRLIPITVQ